MTGNNLSPEQAAQNLAEIDARREQVARMAGPPLPYWFILSMGGLTVARFGAMDLPHPASSILGLLGILAMGALMWLVWRRRKVVFRGQFGPVVVMTLIAWACVTFVLAIVLDFVLIDSTTSLPNTKAGVIVAVLLVGGVVPLNLLIAWQIRRKASAR